MSCGKADLKNVSNWTKAKTDESKSQRFVVYPSTSIASKEEDIIGEWWEPNGFRVTSVNWLTETHESWLLSAVTYHDIWDFMPLTQTPSLSLRRIKPCKRSSLRSLPQQQPRVMIRAGETLQPAIFSLLLTANRSEQKEPVVLKTFWKWNWLWKYLFHHLQLISINFDTPMSKETHPPRI